MTPETLTEALARKRAEDTAAQQAKEDAERQFTVSQFEGLAKALAASTKAVIGIIESHKIEVSNFPDKIGTPDADKVVKAVNGLGKTLKPQKIDNKDVIGVLTELKAALAALPKNMPKLDAVTVKNLNTVEAKLESLLGAVGKIELKPQITVKPADVKVEKTDVSGVIKAVKDVAKAVEDNAPTGGGASATPTDPLIRFTPADIDDATTVQYFGYIATSGEWYIRRFDTSVAPKTIRFSFGSGGATAYNAAFVGRAALTYSLWSA